MKVLYVGHYLEGTSWARAATDYMLAMDSVGIDVVCRPVKLGMPYTKPHDRILELQDKSSSGCDVVIQHVLPHHLVSGPFRKNIALYATETRNFTHSGWANYINLMDEAWVICEDSAISSINSGVSIPIRIVPHTCNPDRYSNKRKKLYTYPKYAGLHTADFVFYSIGEYTQRKNLPALIQAFHTEFDPTEPVSLLLKVNSNQFKGPELLKQVSALCAKIKEDLRLYPSIDDYKQEMIIASYLTDEEILDLHYTANCFVSTSYGEAWNLCCADALAMGKYPIVTKTGGMKDMLETNNACGAVVPAREVVVCGQKDTFDNLFTGRETWDAIDVPTLKKEMRIAYSNWDNPEFVKDREECAENIIDRYSYKRIGNQIKRFLEA